MTGFTSVVSGNAAQHNLAIGPGGTVWAWGQNSAGQLGDGTTTDSPVPVEVPGLSGITALAAGDLQSLAVRSDGTVWAWGSNLGDGTQNESSTPKQVPGLNGVITVASGSDTDYVLKTDGTVWAWGNNTWGQLGNSGPDRHTPVQVSGLTGVVAIAAGSANGLALKSDGTVWAWGQNSAGQLGNNSTTNSNTPVQVLGITGVISSIAAGANHSLALRSDGTVWAWGDGTFGELGNGSTTDSLTAVQVTGLSGATAIAAGGAHSLALKSGSVWTWGYNVYGQLGNGTFTNSDVPAQLSGLNTIVITAGGFGHSLALQADGTVWAWGLNDHGQLGTGSTAGDSPTPTQTAVPCPVATPGPPSVSPPGDYSDSCPATSTAVYDGLAGSLYVKLRAYQPDANDLWVCYRVDNGAAEVTGGRVAVTAPGVTPPVIDGNSTACTSAAGNIVPGPHPEVQALVGPGNTPVFLDTYATLGAASVCFQAGSVQERVAVSAPGVNPSAVMNLDNPAVPAPQPQAPTLTPSGTCQAGGGQPLVNGTLAASTPAQTQVWLYTLQPSSTQLDLCARVQGPVSAGGLITVTGVSPTLQTSTDLSPCTVNLLNAVQPVQVTLSTTPSGANPASFCVSLQGTATRVTAGASGGGVTFTPDPGTP